MKNTKHLRPIPSFTSHEEEAAFWATEDASNYFDLESLRPARALLISRRPVKETLSLRIPPTLRRDLDEVAAGLDLKPTALVRRWIAEKVRAHQA